MKCIRLNTHHNPNNLRISVDLDYVKNHGVHLTNYK